jgi:hypothetical protein
MPGTAFGLLLPCRYPASPALLFFLADLFLPWAAKISYQLIGLLADNDHPVRIPFRPNHGNKPGVVLQAQYPHR